MDNQRLGEALLPYPGGDTESRTLRTHRIS